MYQELGLDQPVWWQFLSYVGRVVTGDMGRSLTTGQPVSADLLSVFPATIELALVAILCGTLVGVPLGVVAAVNRGKPIDHVARVIGLAGHSVPIFWLGLIALIVFYAKLQWVAASGRIDILNEGMVPPITGLLAARHGAAGRMGRVPRRARPHHPARRRPRLLLGRLYQPHDPQLHAGAAGPGIHRLRPGQGRVAPRG